MYRVIINIFWLKNKYFLKSDGGCYVKGFTNHHTCIKQFAKIFLGNFFFK